MAKHDDEHYHNQPDEHGDQPRIPPVDHCGEYPLPSVEHCGDHPSLPPYYPCVEDPPPPPYNPCGQYPPPYNPCIPDNPCSEYPQPETYYEPEECGCHHDPDGIAPFHGYIRLPRSRAYYARSRGWISNHQATEMEGQKNFPAFNNGSHSSDLRWFPGEAGPFPDETRVAPSIPLTLPDGVILSGGRTDARDIVNLSDSQLLTARGSVWPKFPVRPGQLVPISWNHTVNHRTRGYRYFITRPTWNRNHRPTRADFEPAPFQSNFHTNRYFWQESIQSMGPMSSQSILIPSAPRTGHHIILAVWLVADSGAGFYGALDVDFGGGGGGGGGPIEPPPPPPPPPPGGYPQWQLGTRYERGDRVTYQGLNYECIQGHRADSPAWNPAQANTLWRLI